MTEKLAPDSVQPAQVDWRENQPVSTQFDDVYYSTEDGLAESRHVFLNGNDLEHRWRTLAVDSRFTIAETGFGTGLNFLAAVALWLDTAPQNAHLHYVSVEKYPLPRDALFRALANWPELSGLSESLLDSYPPLVGGVHTFWLYRNRVRLTLVFDDAITGFRSLCTSAHPQFITTDNPTVDAWFLDGFAPSKNPDLWSPNLFNLMAAFSDRHTTFATFTVARRVRDGLSEAGFTLEKRPGFGRKRDMLCGRFSLPRTATKEPEWQPPKVLKNSHHEPCWHLLSPPIPASIAKTKTAVVIGAGIAGCSTATALRKRGWHVTVVDKHPQVASEASGNPQGILYPKLSQEDSSLTLFGLHSLIHALGFYRGYWPQHPGSGPSGVLVLPESDREAAQLLAIGQRFRQSPELVRPVSGVEMQDLCGLPLHHQYGLWFENLGWVSPPQVCRWLLDDTPLIKAEVTSLQQDTATGDWHVFDAGGNTIVTATTVIVAMATNSNCLGQTRHLPLRAVRGQITVTPENATSRQLRSVLCGAGYIAPAANGIHTLGATYHIDSKCTDVTESDHTLNFSTLGETDNCLQELWPDVDVHTLEGRASIRCTTPDYLPVVGPAPDETAMTARFADYRRNARTDIPLRGQYHQGLWLNCGHGSRGLTYAPMSAELLASQINGDMAVLPRQLVMALSPARFLIRDIKRSRN
jgi:tRNA 5-methylaminomethyl-2-thiouridine biosynthesis bifunctional protein